METNDRRLFLKLNTEFLVLFGAGGFIVFSFLKNPFLNGMIVGGLFGGINFYLLLVAISIFLYPGGRKILAYGIVILKSLILYGGLAFLLIKIKLNPQGFLAGFGIYTMLMILRAIFSLKRVRDARA